MNRQDELAKRNFYDELMQLRDEQRKNAANAIAVVKGTELPWETNRQGKMRWYLHPNMTDVAIRSLIFVEIEIPAGSRTGRQRIQGGHVLYVWEGRGYTEIDGTKHFWETGDVINLPLLTEGIVVQHFNIDPDSPVRLLYAQPNYAHMLGVDMGSGFEQLEDSPDYRASGGK